jgi:hypothetical protein
MFDILARHAEFFALRQSQPIDLFTLIFVLIVLVPLPFVVLTIIVGRLGDRTSGIAQAIFVGLLFAVVVMPPLASSSALRGTWVLCIALALGALGGVFYARLSVFRRLLTFCSVALVAFPALFLLDPAIRKTAFPATPVVAPAVEIHSELPVVLIVFDELPTNSLLDTEGGIDVELFPGFSELAEGSVWFRNAMAVAMDTHLAVPAVLTGKYPNPDLQPTLQEHPLNLFTLLERTYQMHAVEPYTSLHPANRAHAPKAGKRIRSLFLDLRVIYFHLLLPRDWASYLPPISQSWKNFTGSEQAPVETRGDRMKNQDAQMSLMQVRARTFFEFAEQLNSTPRSLWFMHSILPHAPHNTYPSGRRYTTKNLQPSGEGAQYGLWSQDEWAVDQAYQRHMLQVDLVDNLVVHLVSRLKETGLWDKAIIIVTADHGISFRAGDGRRDLTDTNFVDILSVPLFIRYPGLQAGQINDAIVRSTDLLPTIADLLDAQLGWAVDGISVFGPMIDQRTQVEVFRDDLQLTFEAGAVEDMRREAATRKDALFGNSGADRLFELGPYGGLVGQNFRSFPPPEVGEIQGQISNPERFLNVSLEAREIPGEIVGMIERQPGARPIWIAIVVNGVIRAVTRPYEHDIRPNEARWAAVVPESSFKSGRNDVEIFTLDISSPDQVLLRKVAKSTSKSGFRGVVLGASRKWGVNESGFYEAGPTQRKQHRWTNGKGLLDIPIDPNDLPRELVVKLLGWGPSEVRDLRIVVNGNTLYSGSAPGKSWSKTLDLSLVEPAAMLRVELLSEVWVPLEEKPGSKDRRELGVLVSGVTLR